MINRERKQASIYLKSYKSSETERKHQPQRREISSSPKEAKKEQDSKFKSPKSTKKVPNRGSPYSVAPVQEEVLASRVLRKLANLGKFLSEFYIVEIKNFENSKDKNELNSISSSHLALENHSSISKDDLLRVFEKLPDECFMTDTSWFRKIGLVDKLGVVDFFTLLSNSWQELLLIRMLSPEASQLTQLNGILAKFEVRHDIPLMMKVSINEIETGFIYR